MYTRVSNKFASLSRAFHLPPYLNHKGTEVQTTRFGILYFFYKIFLYFSLHFSVNLLNTRRPCMSLYGIKIYTWSSLQTYAAKQAFLAEASAERELQATHEDNSIHKLGDYTSAFLIII